MIEIHKYCDSKGNIPIDTWLDVASVLLLCAGSKKTQKRDIEQAKMYWRDYCGE